VLICSERKVLLAEKGFFFSEAAQVSVNFQLRSAQSPNIRSFSD
jgi:hypothetical protein